MNGVVAGSARVLTAGIAIVAYALIAHWFSTAPTISTLLLPLAIAPLLLALALKPAWRIGCMLIFLGGIALTFNQGLRTTFAQHLAWIYFIQDGALNAVLGLLFGATLLPGRVPLCSQLAVRLTPVPSAQLLQYTRAVTVAWSGFFAAMITVSTLLFICADRSTWSIFANLLYWPLLLTMFALEYLIRNLVLPADQRAGFIATINAFRQFAAVRAARSPS